MTERTLTRKTRIRLLPKAGTSLFIEAKTAFFHAHIYFPGPSSGPDNVGLHSSQNLAPCERWAKESASTINRDAVVGADFKRTFTTAHRSSGQKARPGHEAPLRLPLRELGFSNACSSLRSVSSRPMFERSGPLAAPDPCTLWQPLQACSIQFNSIQRTVICAVAHRLAIVCRSIP